jgi:fructose-1-phosphate kinase PfkB-like protein
MSYSLHITKKTNFTDNSPEITTEEWEEVINGDTSLCINKDNYIVMNGKKIPVVTWKNAYTNDTLAMYLYEGNIEIDHSREHHISKLKEIANKLNAKVQGDDLEVY